MQPPKTQNTSKDQPSFTTKPFPGSLTPGWNDPPPLPSSTNVERKRTNLNKRVAFPLQSNPIPTVPILPTNVPLVLPLDALEQIITQLNNKLENVPLENKETVKQKLKIMQNVWNSNGLSQEVKLAVYRYSLALRDGNQNLANREVAFLQTNYYAECSDWITTLTIHHI